MGDLISIMYKVGNLPDTEPRTSTKPTYDPNFGFEPPRKKRVAKMSQQEMDALQISKNKQDYCAHFLRDVYVCRRDNKLFPLKCKSETHNYKQCLLDDYILRMKEFEREKRLRLREKKIREMGVSA